MNKKNKVAEKIQTLQKTMSKAEETVLLKTRVTEWLRGYGLDDDSNFSAEEVSDCVESAVEYFLEREKSPYSSQHENGQSTEIIDRIHKKYGVKIKEKTDQELMNRLSKDGLPSLAKLLNMTKKPKIKWKKHRSVAAGILDYAFKGLLIRKYDALNGYRLTIDFESLKEAKSAAEKIYNITKEQ